MQRTGLAFDRPLLFATLPWVVFGGLARVVEDTGMLAAPWRYLLITPLIFFVIFFYAVVVLYLCHRLLGERGVRVYSMVGLASAVVALILLLWYGATAARLDFAVPAVILGLAAITTAALWALLRYGFRWEYVSDRIYQVLIASHMPVSYTHLRAHETDSYLVCRLLLE